MTAAMISRRRGSEVYAVNRQGLHVVSLGPCPEGRTLSWLARDLALLPPGAPVVCFFHYPLAGRFADDRLSVAAWNGKEGGWTWSHDKSIASPSRSLP